MKKIFAVMICLGLSGCYVPADYYYDDYVVTDGYAAPAYSTTYVSSAPTVVYEQPAVIYYDSPILAPRPHYAHYYNPPHHSHHAAPKPAPHHGGGSHHAAPQPGHGGSHGGGHSGGHGPRR